MKQPDTFRNPHPDPELAEGEGPAIRSLFLNCHPVSNDTGACQGFLFDTLPWTHWVLTKRHFALVERF